MSYNGSGTFLINTAGQPVVSGTVISSTAFNALTADLATGLSTCITKDGQTTVTANIPMANYKFTGLGAGSAAGDSANLSQVQSTVVKLLASVSGTDTITAVGSPTVAAYAAGQMFYFVAAGDNTGAVTINIDSLGAKAVTRDGSVALAAGDIKSGEVVVIVYDGTRFQVVSQLNSSGDARFANVSIASSLYVGGVATIVGNAGFSANVSIASALSVGGVATITGTVTGSKFVPTGNVVTGNGMYLPTTNTLAFSTDGTERLRIDSAGNAGLGVTPSAGNAGLNALQIGAVNGLYLLGGSGVAQIGSNYYFSGGYKYGATGAATNYETEGGTHKWYTAASGTAGNTITFTERARITSGGSFQIGSSSGTDPRLLVYDNDSTDTAILVRQDGAAPVQIWQGSGGTELARITSGGALLVGTTSLSASRLVAIDNTGTADDVGIVQNGNSTGFTSNVLVLGATRNTSNSTYNFLSCVVQNVGFRLYIRDSGNVENSNNSYGAISDIKLKENIVDATPKLDDLLKVRIRQYNFKSDESKHKQIGVVAQELEHVFPGLVEEFADRDAENNDLGTTTKSVKYSVFVPMLIKAIQELKAELDATKAEVAALKGA